MSTIEKPTKQTLPPQHQDRQPGIESKMRPRPESMGRDYVGCGRMEGKIALVTGGDSGIGRAAAIAFAKQGADVAIAYLNEAEDAEATRSAVERTGRACVRIAGDLAEPGACANAVQRTIEAFGRVDVLVNNAGEQHPQSSIEDISPEQLMRTFQTNVFAMFYCVQAALPYLKSGARIINTASVTAYRGSPKLLDYSATKGAIVAFTRSLALALVERGILVNAVAPGPVWTPLIPASFDEKKVSTFGADTPMRRPGQPDEIAHAFVFPASDACSYMTGQVLHPNGGEIING